MDLISLSKKNGHNGHYTGNFTACTTMLATAFEISRKECSRLYCEVLSSKAICSTRDFRQIYREGYPPALSKQRERI